MEYETIIGLEVHVELSTSSKLFCSCSTDFGKPPNTQVCPVCLGLPGVMPVVNRKAIEHLIKAALSTDCKIAPFSKFDRKNYFYPDMPKNYQISQYDLPLAVEGHIKIEAGNKMKVIRIKRIHLEEDTGKSTHAGTIDKSSYTLEDYNRAGIPLLEIVTEPDIRTPEEAHAYLIKLKNILRWIDISDCRMEEGSLRCDANISIRKEGEELGIKTEIKNMNSFKSVKDALEFEAKRQREQKAKGEPIIQETRGWDEKKCVTIPMRSKEAEHDYRYFPEPDLRPLIIDPEWIDRLRKSLPELPGKRKKRYMSEHNLSDYDAEFLTSSREISSFFEESCSLYNSPKQITNWLMSDICRILNEKSISIEESELKPDKLSKMLIMLEKGTISGKIAKSIIGEMIEKGADPEIIVKEKGLFQISDEEELQKQINRIISENPEAVSDFKNGKEKIISFLVGQVMKATKGKANPELVNRLLIKKISGGE